jgi:hypothetical protein
LSRAHAVIIPVKQNQKYLIVFIYRKIVNITQPEHYQLYCMHGGIEPAPNTFITLLHGEVLRFIYRIELPVIFFVQEINIFPGLIPNKVAW